MERILTTVKTCALQKRRRTRCSRRARESQLEKLAEVIHDKRDTLSRTAGTASNSVKFSKLAAAYMVELAKGN